MWKQIRGQGFSYSYNMYPRPNEGLVYFSLYSATNAVGAYREAKNIVVSTKPIFFAKLDDNIQISVYFLFFRIATCLKINGSHYFSNQPNLHLSTR